MSGSNNDRIRDAENFFLLRKVGNETFEETFQRLTAQPNSSKFSDQLQKAYKVLRDFHTGVAAEPRGQQVSSFLQQFEFRPGQRYSESKESEKAPAEESKDERRKRLQRERQQRSRAKKSERETQQRRERDVISHSQRRSEETPAETQQRRERNAISHAQNREIQMISTTTEIQQTYERVQSQNIESVVDEHYCGPMNVVCRYCGALYFKDEMPSHTEFTKCCQKRQLLMNRQPYPAFLQSMLSNRNDPDHKNFREHIRSYNSSVSFASMGAKIVNPPGNGPYVFKVQGQIYHLTSHTEPRNENERAYAQLYVLDSATQAVNSRMQHPAMGDCRPSILRKIHDFFIQHNSIARSYQLMKEVQERETILATAQNLRIPVVHMALRSDRNFDERRYNLPTSNEVAMIFVNEDGEPPFQRDIRVYPRNPTNPNEVLFRLNIRNCNLDPMVYGIMFPFGEPGWHPEFKCNNKHFTMLQYKRSLLAIRNEFTPILHAGKLSQQWVVDSYLQVEAHNLEFVRMNQTKLRSDLYQGLYDFVNTRAVDAGVMAGRPIILPSTFEGSPRNMQQRLQDAMAIFAKFGAPDAFITFTCNPNWREIQENIGAYETASDRFDLIDIVFKLKLAALKKDILEHNLLGRRVAYVYAIEFQKRGLPHAHILIVFAADDKFTSSERIDDVVSAEIPDPISNPRLYEIVVRHMLHGPCGERCRGEDGQCTKGFPKEFQESTDLNVGKGYPLYRRRMGRMAYKNNHAYDNRSVVPYNKFLLLKYNAHINVEVCTSVKSIKYIYKYIYKGYDCANCVITEGNAGQTLRYDEINSFVNARYVSGPEAYWRLSAFKMHDRSHAVIALPVHLHRQNVIFFEEGDEQGALERGSTSTKLTAWFRLNENDSAALSIKYSDIPYHYVYGKGEWNRRQRGADKIIGRMHAVSPADQERFSLRLLLLHVPGATSYANIRTFNGVEYETFKEAAIQRGLLASDDEFDAFMAEASTMQMPYQLRQSFAFICVFCTPRNALALFKKYLDHLILDFERQPQYDRAAATNLALHQIQNIFADHNTRCSNFNLPTPTGTFIDAVNYVQAEERLKAERLIPTLNPEQRNAFDKIVNGIDNPSSQKLFFLNGPGGSGKTYLYQTLISFIRGRGESVKAYAFTGIAATLLQSGTTIHSGFGLPIKILDNSTSTIVSSSAAARELRNATILILDEISMLNKDGLRIIEKLLREEVMKNNCPSVERS